jgi:Ca-activated chloride channel family protein
LIFTVPVPSGKPRNISGDFQFAAAVACFGMLLRDSKYKGQASYDTVLELAQGGRGSDKDGSRAEFVQLARTAKALAGDAGSIATRPGTPRYR